MKLRWRSIASVLVLVLMLMFVSVSAISGQIEREDGSASVYLEKGWNLVSPYAFAGSFQKPAEGDPGDIGIHAIFFYDAYNKEYIRLYPQREEGKFNRLWDTLASFAEDTPGAGQDIQNASIWVFSKNEQKVDFNISNRALLTSGVVSLVEGWNFLAVHPELVGKNMTDVIGDCQLLSYGGGWIWNAEEQNWSSFHGSYSTPFSEDQLREGFIVKSANDCTLGLKPITSPPSLPGSVQGEEQVE